MDIQVGTSIILESCCDGVEVYKGEEIAIIGNTGENSSDLIFTLSLWKDDKPLNPEDLISLKAN